MVEFTPEEICENIIRLRNEISKVAERTAAQRLPGAPQPQLLAVSKKHPLEAILSAYKCGQRIFGENYVQELLTKAADPLLPSDVLFDMIGPVQSNKIASLVKGAGYRLRCVHTLTAKHAKLWSQAAVANGRVLPVLMQVNISNQDTKSGTDADAAVADALSIAGLPGLKLCGLMAIPDPADTGAYARLRALAATVQAALPEGQRAGFCELSCGMSGDWAAALENGSTVVRIGTDIFGAREY